MERATITGPLAEIEPVARLGDLGNLQSDLLLDEDFETFDFDEAGWTRSPQADVHGEVGQRSFLLKRLSGSARYGWIFDVEPGQHYVFERSVRCEEVPDADFAVVEAQRRARIGLRAPFDNHYMAGRGLAIKIHYPDPPPADGTWHRQRISFFTTPQTRSLVVMLRPTISAQEAGQTTKPASFDDIRLTQVTPSPSQVVALMKARSPAFGADPAWGMEKHGQFPPLGEVGESYGPTDDNYSYRHALYAPCPTDLSFPVPLAPLTRLFFSVCLSRETPPGDSAAFEVLVRDGEVETSLYRRELSADEETWRWFDERIDLTKFGGRDVELVLRTRALKGHPQPMWGCPSLDVPPKGDGPRNVILIAVDTLRADRMSCYGYERETTPRLDALAADGIRFEQAASNCNWTCPSFASIFTGMVPSRHGVFSYGPRTPLPDALDTLAERFAANGWATQAIAYKPPLYDGNFEQGFDVAFNVPREAVDGNDNLCEALDWLEHHGDRRNFLFLHFNDPHQPFTQPPPFDRMFGDDPATHGLTLPFSMYGGNLPRGETGRRIVRDLYDGAVAYVDDRIGGFLDALKEKGLYEDAVIAFVADHGEQLWEHGMFGHGPTFGSDVALLHDEVTRVPLLVKPGGGKWARGKAVPHQVQGFDVMPTLLELAGIEVEEGLNAHTLRPYLLPEGAGDTASTNDVTPGRAAVTETSGRALAVRQGQWKYILNYSRRPKESLYHLIDDPAELADVAEEHPAQREQMRTLALEYLMAHRPGTYYVVIGEQDDSDSTPLRVQGAASAALIHGASARPRDGGLDFQPATGARLRVAAEITLDATFDVGEGEVSLEHVPDYEPGQLQEWLNDPSEQLHVVRGPQPVRMSPSNSTLDARQLEALRALGYLPDEADEADLDDDANPEADDSNLESASRSSSAVDVGDAIPSTRSLRDLRGTRRALADLVDRQAIVLCFLGTECPLANLYIPRLIDLAERFESRGVRFVAVYPNEHEDLAEIAAHAGDRSIPFLVVKDQGQRLADMVGVTRTPSVVVLDDQQRLQYRGRIDDQYFVGGRRPTAERQELVAAIDAMLTGEAVAVQETEADGCLLDRATETTDGPPRSYHRDVVPILQRRCESCHRHGQIGPFPLQSYPQAFRRRAMIREVVTQRRMPPWHADQRAGHFANDRSLSDSELAILRAWVDQGAPEGDAQLAPPARVWPDAGQLEDPDEVLSLPRPVSIPADGFMDYVYQQTPTDYGRDVWVQDAEIRPGDASVLHHVLIYIQPPGSSGRGMNRTTRALVNWVPGTMPKRNPPGTATRIPAGSTLLWEMHYTPNGLATKDRTTLALKFAATPPKEETHFGIWANFRIRIPAGAQHHEEEARLTVRQPSRLVSLRPHMHLRGKSWRYEAEFPDGRRETLLNVPNWNFDWQTEYFLDEPLALPVGTVLYSIATWDNSTTNLLNPDPNASVGYGLQTDREMMNGWVKFATPRAGAEQEVAPLNPVARVVFGSIDLDQDGWIRADEWEAKQNIREWFEGEGVTLALPVDLERFCREFPKNTPD